MDGLPEILTRLKEKSRQPKTTETTTGDGEREKKRHDADLERAGIPRRFADTTFAAIEKRGVPEQLAANLAVCREYALHLAANIKAGRGLMLSGGPGTLKTTLAIAILRHHLDSGGSGLFLPMPSLIDTLFTMKARDKEEWSRYENKIRKTKLLVLDDFGAEITGQDWITAKVDGIITDRYNNLLPTIITTNFTIQFLKEKYPARVVDRLKSTAELITSEGESLR